jgi:hypothetical protein
MAITKINTPELFDLGTTNSSLRLPSGDTASRPSNPNTGEWNTILMTIMLSIGMALRGFK